MVITNVRMAVFGSGQNPEWDTRVRTTQLLQQLSIKVMAEESDNKRGGWRMGFGGDDQEGDVVGSE